AASGTVMTQGRGFELLQWMTDADFTVAGGVNARDRITLPGRSRLRSSNNKWRLEGQHRVGDVAPVDFMLSATVTPNGRIPMGGSLQLGATSAPALASVLTTVGLASIPPSLFTDGTVTAMSSVGGELTRPTLKGTAVLQDLRGEQFALGPARVEFDGAPLA